jgi:hypothetical protein
MKAKLVYDFANDSFHLFPFIFFGISLFCAGYVWIRLKKHPKKTAFAPLLLKEETTLGAILMGVFCFFLGYSLLNPEEYIHTKNIYSTGQFKQTAGYITKLEERNFSKYHMINFTLNGLNFDFADNTAFYGCDYDDISHTYLADSTYLHIFYFTEDGRNRALRIETFK